MTPTQQDHIMANTRKIHRKRATVTNAQIAIDMVAGSSKDNHIYMMK